jgi:peptidoglycan/xylan/chitin deacetylase (PgdA/CDA1 family)
MMKIVLTFDIERDIPRVFNSYFGIKIGLLKILEILEKFNIKGTFFCSGNIIKHLPNYINQIESKGHEIACHGLNHERLNLLDYDNCYQLIFENKELLEKICPNSEIIGFRAPYLKAPLFLFKILMKLGFKYDSSISSPKKLRLYQMEVSEIYEFPPSSFNAYFRFPINLRLFFNRFFKKDFIVLYFHPWEAINMRTLILSQNEAIIRYKNLLFRPDRWVNTGEKFLSRLRYFIKNAQSKGVRFVTLKDLILE